MCERGRDCHTGTSVAMGGIRNQGLDQRGARSLALGDHERSVAGVPIVDARVTRGWLD